MPYGLDDGLEQFLPKKSGTKQHNITVQQIRDTRNKCRAAKVRVFRLFFSPYRYVYIYIFLSDIDVQYGGEAIYPKLGLQEEKSNAKYEAHSASRRRTIEASICIESD